MTTDKPEEAFVWESRRPYRVGNEVFVLHEWFTCIADHQSDVFSKDFFDNRYWRRGRDRVKRLIEQAVQNAKNSFLEPGKE